MPDDRETWLPRRSSWAPGRVRGALSRPPEMVEATRWLFWLLAMISLALTAPGPLANGRALPAVAGLVLVGFSLTLGYLLKQAHWGWDLLDGATLVAIACSCPSPGGVLALVFAMIWFRSLYGSTGGALARGAVYATALTATLLVWPLLPGTVPDVEGPVILSSIPTMLVTVVAARHLAGILWARQQAAQRDAIHAAAGSQLLAVTDPIEIRRIAWEATAAICATSPGLRSLGVRPYDDGLLVIGHTGDFTEVPTVLSADVCAVLEHHQAGTGALTGLSDLDDAVGSVCVWRSLTAFDPAGSGWLVLGSQRAVPDQVVDTLTSLMIQVVLALRNSQAHQELTVQATFDSLTGLANRGLFNTALTGALADAAGSETAVLFVDLDDFKDVNDVFGHGAGDELLRVVAGRITAATRTEDLCARLGGDEFAVLLPHTDGPAASEVARRIVTAVGRPLHLAAGATQISVSVGLAVDAGGGTAEQLVQRADIAMYAAKAGGKGRMKAFSEGLLQGDAAQVAFDRQLMAATANNELVVLYQPVVSMPAGRCTAVEALVRWQHPERGLLGPAEFIDAAERTGAIHDIGAFVLRRACADVSRWRRSRDDAAMAVHVNVSALQLDVEEFHTTVLECLEEFSMAPRDLVLEITETVVIASPAAKHQLNRLAGHGVVLAIDDFGTGYSALTSLRALPVSIVKIDKSFVAGSTVNAEDRAVTEAVVQMAGRMGLHTIAEGVERPDQLAFLESIGADAAQGYLYLRPAMPTELYVWLDDNLAEPSPSASDVVLRFPARSGRARR